jgi:hypothetical protein
VARWGQFTRESKLRVVERMRQCANVKALAAELQVSRQALTAGRRSKVTPGGTARLCRLHPGMRS